MGLTRVVVATSDRDVVRWLQPDLMITLDAEFGSLHRNPCRDTPPRPRVSIRYATDRFDVATPSAAQLNGADLVEAAGGVNAMRLSLRYLAAMRLWHRTPLGACHVARTSGVAFPFVLKRLSNTPARLQEHARFEPP